MLLLSILEARDISRFSACQGHLSHRPHLLTASHREKEKLPFIRSIPCRLSEAIGRFILKAMPLKTVPEASGLDIAILREHYHKEHSSVEVILVDSLA